MKKMMIVIITVLLLVPVMARASEAADQSVMQKEFNTLLDSFKSGRDFNEIAMQQLLDLLSAEIDVVNLLLVGHSGAVIEQSLYARNKRLSHTIPSVAVLYDKIMDLVASDEITNRKLSINMKGKKDSHLVKALTCREKKTFLYRMRDGLNHYYAITNAMQCDISLAAGAGVMVETEGNGISFCPIVR